MTPVLDLNKMASSIYNTVIKMQESATQMVGIDTLWCRAVPHQDSADVVIQEYTLSHVECPKALKVISEKSDYQAGTYNVDLWGVTYEAPLEISINISTWESVYGKGTAPQKGDICYVQILNRLYEVASSTIVYTLTTLPSSYRCSLKKYQRSAARRENQELKISIDELTQAQDEIFGDAISNEVADAVIERETSYNQSTLVDPIRVCDLKAIVTEDITGASGNFISRAYHHFAAADSNLYIKGTEARYGENMDPVNTHWIYSCWFRIGNLTVQKTSKDETGNDTIETTTQEIPVQLGGLYTKDKGYYSFYLKPDSPVGEHEEVILYRGTLLSLSGIISKTECNNRLIIMVPTSEVLAANKKAMRWWESIKTGWKIKRTVKMETINGTVNKKQPVYDLLSGYLEDEETKAISVSYTGTRLKIQFGHSHKDYKAPDIQEGVWHYMMLDFYAGKVRVCIAKQVQATVSGRLGDKLVCDKEYSLGPSGDFMVSSFGFNNKENDIDMCNLRLYEAETGMGNEWKTDMYSELTRNASKLIFIDNPKPVNNMTFVSPLR